MKHYADAKTGEYLGGTDGTPPDDSVETPSTPLTVKDTWDGQGWVTPAGLLRDSLKTRLNADFNEAMATVHAGWPDYEIQTWTVQNDEARAWLAAPADAKPSAPLLSGMHATRTALGWPEPFEDFVGRVIRNSDQYTTAVAALLAIRHVSERAIEEAEDLTTVQWSFDLSTNEIGN